MRYDPFARGPWPAGVRTSLLQDAARAGRPMAIEVWYPAAAVHDGADLGADSRDMYDLVPGLPRVPQDAVRNATPRAGHYPLVVFSHGLGGHRRQSTFLCTHLASHGYVVAACDHPGSTMLDLLRARGRLDAEAVETRVGAPRADDLRFVVDRVLDGSAGDVAALTRAERIAATGHSLGGWASLVLARRDARVRSLALMAPAGGRTHGDTRALRAALDFAFGRPVPSLWLVAERDAILPLDGIEALYADAEPPKQLVVLADTDHLHFCDRGEDIHELFRRAPPAGIFARGARDMAPVGELAAPAQTRMATRGLVLAHLDATLGASEAAVAFLSGGLAATLAALGVAARVR
jgi:dienelactone hydrolase